MNTSGNKAAPAPNVFLFLFRWTTFANKKGQGQNPSLTVTKWWPGHVDLPQVHHSLSVRKRDCHPHRLTHSPVELWIAGGSGRGANRGSRPRRRAAPASHQPSFLPSPAARPGPPPGAQQTAASPDRQVCSSRPLCEERKSYS